VGPEPDTVATIQDEPMGSPPDGVDPIVDEEPIRDTDDVTDVVRRVTPETGATDGRSDRPEALKATDGSGASVEPGQPTRVDGATLVARLADAVREDRVSEEDLSVLASAFGPSASQDTRVSHLQSRVSDLEAYTDALEAFIDENGTAQQLFEEVDADLSETRERLADVESRLGTGEEKRSNISKEVEAMSDRVATIEEGLADLGAKLEALHRDLARVDRSHEDLEARVAELGSLEAELDDLRDSMDDEVSDLAATVDSVRETADATRTDVEETISDVEDLREWREQLTSVLGADSTTD
jgi:predicted  nucleic acid-binding Zn-ribbon protein